VYKPLRQFGLARFSALLVVLILTGLSGCNREANALRPLPPGPNLVPASPIAAPVSGQPWALPLPGKVAIELMPVPSGDFMMGPAPGEVGSQSYQFQIHVTLTRPFWVGKFAITQEQWQTVMGSTIDEYVSHFDEEGYFVGIGPNYPMYSVTWFDAAAYCRKLTGYARVAGCLPTGYEFRLPTVAEREYACRAGTTGPYGGTGILDEMAWYKGNSGDTAPHHVGVPVMHPVGQKKPNDWGLYDMNGNTPEWCLDLGVKMLKGANVTDPYEFITDFHGVRGGWFLSDPKDCRSASAGGATPTSHDANGFRIVLAPVILPVVP
jgi:formylglycine-generating enzyme required for sulfatase activity